MDRQNLIKMESTGKAYDEDDSQTKVLESSPMTSISSHRLVLPDVVRTKRKHVHTEK